jgi:hypothetical protein
MYPSMHNKQVVTMVSISNQPFVATPRQEACIRQHHMRELFTAVVTTARQIIVRHEGISILDHVKNIETP